MRDNKHWRGIVLGLFVFSIFCLPSQGRAEDVGKSNVGVGFVENKEKKKEAVPDTPANRGDASSITIHQQRQGFFPQTGEQSSPLIWLMGGGLVLLAGGCLVYQQKKRQENA